MSYQDLLLLVVLVLISVLIAEGFIRLLLLIFSKVITKYFNNTLQKEDI